MMVVPARFWVMRGKPLSDQMMVGGCHGLPESWIDGIFA